MLIDRRYIAHFDWVLFLATMLIPLAGLIVLYSAGYDPDAQGISISSLGITIQSATAVKQFCYLCAGLLVIGVAMSIPTSILHRLGYALYAFCFIMLLVVLKLGTVQNGSRRWFSLGAFNFQPAELMKLGLVLCLARYLARTPPASGGYGLKQLILPFLSFLAPMALIMSQPDLGTALVVGAIGFGMVLFMGVRPKVLLLLLLSVAIAVVPAWHKLHPYQKRRILVLFDPEVDPRGSGYHIIQSKIAVGSGGLTGRGYMQGTQAHLEFLPEHTTDFIFSVLAEEWGFVGCMFVISLYAFFLYRMLKVVVRSKDMFSCLVAFGITTSIFAHVVVNIGMVVGILPVVGIPLPLFSYGGSSMLSILFSIGLVLGIAMRRFSHIVKN